MTEPKILSTREFNPDNIVVGTASDRNVTFYYPLTPGSDEYSKLRIQTPMMRIAFDPDEKKTKEGKTFVKNICFSTDEIGSSGNKKNLKYFREKIKESDRKMFGLLPEVLQTKALSNSLWQGKNKNYGPTFKASMPYKDNVCKSFVFDENDDRVSDDEVQRGVTASAILKLDNMWIWNDKIGVNWSIDQLKIYDKKQTTNTDVYDDQPPTKVKFKIRKED